MKKIKVLHVLKGMDMGGIETYIMNILRNIDKNKFQLDFLLWSTNKTYYEDEIKYNGCNIYKFKFKKNPIGNIIYFSRFLKNKNYDVIHCHSLFYCGFFALGNYFINRRNNIFISHAHSKSDNYKNSILRNMYKQITRFLILNYSTYLCACSNEASKYVFNRKAIILKDYIDTDKYLNFDVKGISKIKKKYKIKSDTFVVGNIGRLSVEKNQKFIINIIDELVRRKFDIRCFFIGDGPEKKHLENIVRFKNLDKNIIFTGTVSKVENYLHCMNVFLFPSLYEGFGISLLEAQASGINCLASDNVPKITDMDLGLVKYLKNNDINIWVSELCDYKKVKLTNDVIKNNIINHGFDVSNSINIIEKLYEGKKI